MTRDTALAQRRGVQVIWIEREDLDGQLDQLYRELGLAAAAPFTRCPVCNGLLEAVPKYRAWGQVPTYVFATQSEFRRCPSCGRFYWRGTHWDHMRELVAHWREV